MLLIALLLAAVALLVLVVSVVRGLGRIDDLLQVVGPDDVPPPVHPTA
ncbi:MAG: hypothetical protein AAGF99_08925 [Bacteroidota bacterium]